MRAMVNRIKYLSEQRKVEANIMDRSNFFTSQIAQSKRHISVFVPIRVPAEIRQKLANLHYPFGICLPHHLHSSFRCYAMKSQLLFINKKRLSDTVHTLVDTERFNISRWLHKSGNEKSVESVGKCVQSHF